MNSMDIKADSILDPSITFEGSIKKNWTYPKAIFLTGATGLVGAYLLDVLLTKTDDNIYCLIRGKNSDEAKERLIKHLKFHTLWQEKFISRIIPIIGDLSKPLLGLSDKSFHELADTIDVIYHNGALVNFLYPYSALKASNVLGTQEVIRLASFSKIKQVHFVSTVAVFFSQTYFAQKIVKETDIPIYDDSLKGGYKQSKWVSEKLIMRAKERGMPTVIYRPVRILGASTTGIVNFHDSLCHLLKACIEIKKYPTLNTVMTFVPVDYVSQAIVYLSLQEKSLNKEFHLTNPYPISYRDFLKEVCSLGYEMEEIPYTEWFEELKKAAEKNPKDVTYSFLMLFLRDANNLLLKQMDFEANNTVEGLSGSSIVCPNTDTKLISTYLNYFQKTGYIPTPLT
ncbi:MAG: thioester reductase domain-containing protein [Desulfobacterales bacterium]|nr:thioester reductase domain-containing protein [Desulfobacterales bacterium]